MVGLKGLVMINTGNGKGKTTAALGLALRFVGHGQRVLIIQFIKGAWVPGEVLASGLLEPHLKIKVFGQGFVRKSLKDADEMAIHKRAAQAALEAASAAMRSGDYSLVILDEINNALSLELLAADEVISALDSRREVVHVLLTGRNAHPRLVEMADTVTEMLEIKHHYKAGIKAQEGIEY